MNNIDQSIFNNLKEEGFALWPEYLTTQQCASLNSDLNQWIKDEQPNQYGFLRNNLHKELPSFSALLPDFADLARRILQTDQIVLLMDNLIWKPPNTQQKIEWHQDFAYWPLSSPQGLTFWIALDETSQSNGCMSYIPKTHLLGERQATNFTAPGAAPWNGHLPPLNWEDHKASKVFIEVQQGTLSIHHPLLWHSSGLNTTQRDRRAWSLSWTTPQNTWKPSHAPHPYNHQLNLVDDTRITQNQLLFFPPSS